MYNNACARYRSFFCLQPFVAARGLGGIKSGKSYQLTVNKLTFLSFLGDV